MIFRKELLSSATNISVSGGESTPKKLPNTIESTGNEKQNRREKKMESEKLAVNVSEAAKMLSVSRPTMYEILNREDCRADFKLGSRRLVSVEALREWIAKQTMQ